MAMRKRDDEMVFPNAAGIDIGVLRNNPHTRVMKGMHTSRIALWPSCGIIGEC